MNTVRIWFNQWFSTAYHIINLIKADKNTKFHVIGSSMNPYSAVSAAADEWYTENDFESDEAYVDFCLAFCREHKIDIFAPHRRTLAITKAAAEFNAIGVKLLCDCDYEKTARLANKETVYRFFGEFAPEIVPEHYTVHTAEELEKAYRTLFAENESVCLKLTEDEGASSFRIIDNTIGQHSLFESAGLRLTYRDVVKALEKNPYIPEHLVMPYMKGIEVSADCLDTPTGLIVLPRFKIGGRTQEIRFDDEIIAYCKAFHKHSKLRTPFNVQFRYHNDKLCLLEVNTRMSGGVHYASVVSEVNIPNIAVNQLIGIDVPYSITETARKFSYVESVVLL